MVTITPRESYRRERLIALSVSRQRRATSGSSVFIRFRTRMNQELLLFTSVTGGSKYNAIAVSYMFVAEKDLEPMAGTKCLVSILNNTALSQITWGL